MGTNTHLLGYYCIFFPNFTLTDLSWLIVEIKIDKKKLHII